LSLIEIIGIAVGLAIDAMSVAIAVSLMLGRVNAGHIFRFAFFFGLFQGLMPIIGWALGSGIEQFISAWDHWVAFILLAMIGLKGIHEALKGEDGFSGTSDPTRGWPLLVLSVATSIDALAVGLNFGVLNVSVWIPALVIALVTAGLTTAGMLLSSFISPRLKKYMQIFGGLVLIAIGLKILIESLFAGS
jgi:putative Mn2+ efflux pump MntP